MKVFVAGATGATGQVFVPMAEKAGIPLTLHVRPQSREKSPLGSDPRAAVFDLSDEAALDTALRGHDAIVSFVGTMRSRSSQGDDYASSDVASAKSLGAAAERVGVPRILLLSSVGAGGAGAYLKMKLECEQAVQRPGIAWTVFRPSVLVSPEWAADGTHANDFSSASSTMRLRSSRVVAPRTANGDWCNTVLAKRGVDLLGVRAGAGACCEAGGAFAGSWLPCPDCDAAADCAGAAGSPPNMAMS